MGTTRRAARQAVALCALALVLVSCSGSNGSGDAASSAEGIAIEGPEPTSTTVPTATPEGTVAPTPTIEPTAEPTATLEPGPEAEVIEAWERYLRLSIEARGRNPSPESLDFDSYVISDAKQGLVQVIADYAAAGQFVRGTMTGGSPSVEIRNDGAAIVSDCASVDLAAIAIGDGSELESDVQTTLLRGRLVPETEAWRVAAFEFTGRPCDG